MALNQEEIHKFNEQRERLGKMLTDASDVVGDLNMTDAKNNLEKLGDKVNNDTLKIQVIGTFKNGKSTFINSLLGEDVLPAFVRPCTAVINEVKYGETKHAVIYFRNPLPETMPSTLSQKAIAHMKEYNMTDVPPLEVDYKELADYVVIPLNGDLNEMLMDSPYEKVELYWPLDILKEGVEIVDSPGLNEAATRTKVTMEYLTKADAIIFVLDATHLCSSDEMSFIEHNLKESGFTDPFFVTNRFDLIENVSEQNDIRQLAAMHLKDYTTNDLYFVSAKQALDGEKQNDKSLIEKSGILKLTDDISNYLTKKKGRIKLSQPVSELKRVLTNEALYKVIPSQLDLLDHSLDDVEKRYDAMKPRLDNLRVKKAQLLERLTNRIDKCRHDLERAAERQYVNISGMVPAWITPFTPKHTVEVLVSKSKKEAQIQTVINEISDHVKPLVEEQQNLWKKEVLNPMVEEQIKYIFTDSQHDIEEILADIDTIIVDLTGKVTMKGKEVPVWERIVGGAGGLLLGDIGLAVSGGINGLSKDMLKVAAIEFGGGALLSLLGWLNPYTIGAMIIVVIIQSIVSGEKQGVKKVKEAVIDDLMKKITENKDANAAKMAADLAEKYSQIANGIAAALDTEIKQAEDIITGVVNEIKKGKDNIDNRKRVIANCEERIKVINTGLDELTFELIG